MSETPIEYTVNDIANKAWDDDDNDYSAFLVMKKHALELQSKLADARAKLKAVTEQRDRLAETVSLVANRGQSIEPDHWKFREWAREICQRSLQSLTTNVKAMASADTQTTPKETTL